MLKPHDATLHHETGDSVDLGGSFNTAPTETVPCFMVHCCIVWKTLTLHLCKGNASVIVKEKRALSLHAFVQAIKRGYGCVYALSSLHSAPRIVCVLYAIKCGYG